MADTEGYFDQQGRLQTRTTKTAGDVANSDALAAAQDASRIKPKPTGRGMVPGETIDQWKKRIRKMDEDKEAQTRALKGMSDATKQD